MWNDNAQLRQRHARQCIPLWNVESMLLAPQRTLARALATLAAILALLALSLAGIGIYGVMAYVVSQRTQEIGIRIALGATAGRVLQRIAIEGLRPVLVGMVVGLAGWCKPFAASAPHARIPWLD